MSMTALRKFRDAVIRDGHPTTGKYRFRAEF